MAKMSGNNELVCSGNPMADWNDQRPGPLEEKQIFFSPELAHRLGAIDIGSNSVRLMVAEPLRGGNYRILDEESEATRLGRALNSSGRLDPEAVELTLAALRRVHPERDGISCGEVGSIATRPGCEAVN